MAGRRDTRLLAGWAAGSIRGRLRGASHRAGRQTRYETSQRCWPSIPASPAPPTPEVRAAPKPPAGPEVRAAPKPPPGPEGCGVLEIRNYLQHAAACRCKAAPPSEGCAALLMRGLRQPARPSRPAPTPDGSCVRASERARACVWEKRALLRRHCPFAPSLSYCALVAPMSYCVVELLRRR